MYVLKSLSLSDGRDIYEMLQEIGSNENGFHNKVNGMSFSQFKDWLAKEYAVDNGELEAWMVPQSSYWMYDGAIPVGYGRIRHCLNEALREQGGHIGYAIARSKRGRGYGNAILALLIQECRSKGIDELQISAHDDNVLSNKAILKNGGVFIRQAHGKRFYAVDLRHNPPAVD